MASDAQQFPRRNGFALRSELDHPVLQRHLHQCLQANEEFSRTARLEWSRRWEYPYVLANLPADASGQRVLDAGSGYRFFAPLLARHGFVVDACDLDGSIGPRYDEVAARYDVAIEFTQQNLAKLTYADECFDFICCISVLEHARERVEIVREFKRCLKPRGSLLLTFDVSVRGDRDIPIAAVRDLIDLLEDEFSPAAPFDGRALLEPGALRASERVLRTEWFRQHEPELLPWRFVSRAWFRNALRGRFGRPFFDLAVVGMVLRKPDQGSGASP